MKPSICLGLFVSTLAFAGAPIDQFNETAAAALASGSVAEQEAHALLRGKIVDDWGVPADRFVEVVRTLSDAHYTIRVDAECSQYADRLIQRGGTFLQKLEMQVASAARFLADYHGRVLGNNESLFKIRDIIVCTDPVELDTPYLGYDRFKSELRLKVGPRLRLAGHLPHLRDNIHPLTRDELREKWNEGEQWATDGLFIIEVIHRRRSPLRSYWPYINPVGEIRTGLREFIRREGLQRGLSLRSAVESDWERLVDVARALLSGTRQTKLDEALSRASSPRDLAVGVLTRWSDRLLNSRAAEEMGIANLAALGETAREMHQTDIERTQIGLVNVENFHQIDVQFTAGDVREYQQFVVVPQELKIKVRQFGLVNVSTGDDVRVKAFLGLLLSPGNFEKATLARVVDTL